MQQFPEEIKALINDSNFLKLHSLGLIDEIGLRNHIIKEEYKLLRAKHSLLDALFVLSDKYSLSDAAINSIVFRKRRTKSLNILTQIN